MIVGLLSVNYMSRGVYDLNSIVPVPIMSGAKSSLKTENEQNSAGGGFDILKYSEDFDFMGNQKIAWMGRTFGNPEVFWATFLVSILILLGVNFSSLQEC